MTGLGTIINSVSIIAGGLLGHLTGKLFNQEQQDAISKNCGVSVLFIAIAGAMEGMLKIEGTEQLRRYKDQRHMYLGDSKNNQYI